jgi:hypothetical protein
MEYEYESVDRASSSITAPNPKLAYASASVEPYLRSICAASRAGADTGSIPLLLYHQSAWMVELTSGDLFLIWTFPFLFSSSLSSSFICVFIFIFSCFEKGGNE